jgi:Thioredoxin
VRPHPGRRAATKARPPESGSPAAAAGLNWVDAASTERLNVTKGPDCGSCHKPLFTAHSTALDERGFAQLEPKVRLAKVNTDQAQSLGARHSIRSIPTLALFMNGRELARRAGAMGEGDIVRWVQAQLR